MRTDFPLKKSYAHYTCIPNYQSNYLLPFHRYKRVYFLFVSGTLDNYIFTGCLALYFASSAKKVDSQKGLEQVSCTRSNRTMPFLFNCLFNCGDRARRSARNTYLKTIWSTASALRTRQTISLSPKKTTQKM